MLSSLIFGLFIQRPARLSTLARSTARNTPSSVLHQFASRRRLLHQYSPEVHSTLTWLVCLISMINVLALVITLLGPPLQHVDSLPNPDFTGIAALDEHAVNARDIKLGQGRRVPTLLTMSCHRCKYFFLRTTYSALQVREETV